MEERLRSGPLGSSAERVVLVEGAWCFYKKMRRPSTRKRRAEAKATAKIAEEGVEEVRCPDE